MELIKVLLICKWYNFCFLSVVKYLFKNYFLLRYRSDDKAYKEKICSIVKESQDQLYDVSPNEDKHYLTFELYDPQRHDAVKASMLNQANEERPKAVGHSWVASRNYKPLSRAPSPNSESES